MKSTQFGRSMIEMIGVLSVVGVLSVGGITGYSKMMSQYKVNKAIEQIVAISSKISQVGAQSGTYDGLTNASATKFGAVPFSATASTDGSVLKNPFNGNMTIASKDLIADSGDQQAYTIRFDNVPESACVALASHGWSSNQSASLVGIAAGSNADVDADVSNALAFECTGAAGTGYAVACSGGSTVNIPMSPGMAATGCDCPSGSCFLIWMFF